MSFLIISIVVNCFVLIASAQDEASAVASADSFASAVANSSAPLSGESKARTADKVYNSCGTACPLTCAQPKPRNCIKICKADYFCPQGYYENSQGKCVLLEDCDSAPTPVDSTPSESKPNTVEKVYKECGSPCRLTCGKAAPDSCIAVCESGLFCPDGYYENSANKCVLPEYCDSAPTTTEPPRHLPGHIVYRPPTAEKVYSECGSTCPLKCSSPKPQICNALCRPGFACPKGYYENSDDKCVLPEYCDSAPTTTEPPRHLPGNIVGRPRPRPPPFPINDPSPSWPNEFKPRIVGKVYSDCGSACPRKCGQSEKRACPLICVRGWSCPSDYYENSLGQCVLLEDLTWKQLSNSSLLKHFFTKNSMINWKRFSFTLKIMFIISGTIEANVPIEI
ncbi:furin-like protease 2 [Panonychus citri]|uniref:furin-like protease 2 n=1 Tax=Panonychus citri TaxID=50023 RepID=UPI0023075C06|nr:furin-like protease 2 [Panonychus citri]